jgi:hypothetical protein
MDIARARIYRTSFRFDDGNRLSWRAMIAASLDIEEAAVPVCRSLRGEYNALFLRSDALIAINSQNSKNLPLAPRANDQPHTIKHKQQTNFICFSDNQS